MSNNAIIKELKSELIDIGDRLGTCKFETLKISKDSQLLLRIEGAGDGSRANFDYGIPLDQLSYDNPIT